MADETKVKITDDILKFIQDTLVTLFDKHGIDHELFETCKGAFEALEGKNVRVTTKDFIATGTYMKADLEAVWLFVGKEVDTKDDEETFQSDGCVRVPWLSIRELI